MINADALNTLFYYVERREQAKRGHDEGTPKPWCDDPIIQNYRFCNVNRQDDPVTIELQDMCWTGRVVAFDPATLWFNIVIARVFNNPETIRRIGYISDWDDNKFVWFLNALQYQKVKLYNAAYMIHARTRGIPKHEYYARDVFTPMWEERATAPIHSQKLEDWAEHIGKYSSMGPFMRNQMVADIRYSPYHEHGGGFLDWDTWVEAGPGTLKGLNYLHGREQGSKVPDPHAELMELQSVLTKHPMMPPYFIDPNNCSNVMCEFSKYMRTKEGTGRPKQKYPGA